MISPTALVKRAGAAVEGLGGGRRLGPFFKFVGVYWVAWGGAAPGPLAVAAKCAPVLCLLLLVLQHLRSRALPPHRARYARRVALGLALSALGDAALEAGAGAAPLAAGLALFAGALGAYAAALGAGGGRRAGAVLFGAAALYNAALAPPPPLRALVPAYSALLAELARRGLARGGAAAAGAALFAASDAVLGYSLFGGPVPCKQPLVMCTYYLGQLGFALSALDPPPPAPPVR